MVNLQNDIFYIYVQSDNYTVRNIRKFTKFLSYKGKVKFDDVYDVFEQEYLKIAKNVLNFLKFFFIL